jgi:hypothetical protein
MLAPPDYRSRKINFAQDVSARSVSHSLGLSSGLAGDLTLDGFHFPKGNPGNFPWT